MRGKPAKKRAIAPDVKYGSATLAKFINHIMRGGKKTVAQKVVYGALERVQEQAKRDPLRVFEEAIRNVSPQMEVRSRRVGGANYQVPLPVRGDRQFALACRWIIGAARVKKGQPMDQKLSQIFLDSSQNLGDAIKKRDDVHRMAESNKAFAHFARFRR